MRTFGEENASNKPQDNSEDSAVGALESAERYLAGSPSAGSSCDGSGAAFSATFSSLVDWAQERALVRTQSDFNFFVRSPDSTGNEHEVWFDAPSSRWFKATYENKFGLAWGREETATPHEYLIRLLLQNIYFGDDIRLVSLIQCGKKIRILTSQPHVAGDFATYDEIQKWFNSMRFRRINTGGSIAWYFLSENLLVADAHEGNIIRTAVGTLVPIDINVIQPRGPLFDSIQFEITGQLQLTLPL